jgi:hypothetical protein
VSIVVILFQEIELTCVVGKGVNSCYSVPGDRTCMRCRQSSSEVNDDFFGVVRDLEVILKMIILCDQHLFTFQIELKMSMHYVSSCCCHPMPS